MKFVTRLCQVGIAFSLLALTSIAAAADPTAADAPVLSLVWQQAVPPTAQRVAVADLRNNHRQLLVLELVGKSAEERIVSIRSWDKAKLALLEDGAVITGSGADRLEAGEYGTAPGALIAMPDGYIRDVKGAYVLQKATASLSLLGGAWLKNGKTALVVAGEAAVEGRLVDVNGIGEAWTVPGPLLPAGLSTDLIWADVRGPILPVAGIITQLGAPDDTPTTTFFGVWTPAGSKSMYVYLPKHRVTGTNKGDYAALYKADEGDGSGLPHIDADTSWTSTALSGAVIDIAPGTDVRSGSGQGLYVLAGAAAPGKDRMLYFFAAKTTQP